VDEYEFSMRNGRGWRKMKGGVMLAEEEEEE